MGSWAEEVTEERKAVLEVANRLQGSRQESERITVGNYDLEVWSRVRRPYGQYRFQASGSWAGGRFHLCEPGWPMVAFIELDSEPLMRYDAKWWWATTRNFLGLLGAVITESRWDRADFRVDAVVPCGLVTQPLADGWFVGGGNGRVSYEGEPGMPETVYVGRPKGKKSKAAAFLRAYNKTLEVQGDENNLRAESKVASLRENLGLDDGPLPDVVRLEWQLHGSTFRNQMAGVESVEKLIEKQAAVLAWCFDWIRPTESMPDRARKHQSRAKTLPLYEAIRAAAMEQVKGNADPLSKKPKREWGRRSETEHFKRMWKDALNASAIHGGKMEDFATIMTYVMEGMYRTMPPEFHEQRKLRRAELVRRGLASWDGWGDDWEAMELFDQNAYGGGADERPTERGEADDVPF